MQRILSTLIAASVLFNVSCAKPMVSGAQDGSDIPMEFNLSNQDLRSVRGLTGTAIGASRCVLTADNTHMLRLGNLVQDVTQYQPTEAGSSIALLGPVKRGLLTFKALLSAQPDARSNVQCTRLSRAFYDFTYGWVESLILVWYFVLGNAWETAWPLVNEMMSGNESQFQAALNAQKDHILERMGEEGPVLFDVLTKSAGIFFNPNSDNLVAKIDEVLALIDAAPTRTQVTDNN